MSDTKKGGEMNKAQARNGEIAPGDWVLVTEAPPCSYLVGQITEIVPTGSRNSEPADIHVNFMDAGYSDERKAEILDEMNSFLHRGNTSLNAFGLDDVVIPPHDLIRITEIDRDKFTELLEGGAVCAAYCKEVAEAVAVSKEAALIERFDKNLADYHASLEGFTARELIGMADKIAATDRIHAYMTQEHGMDDSEIDFFLQFQNPLEVVADAWHDHGDDTEGMDSVVYDVCYQQNVLPDYPRMSDLSPFHEFAGDEGQRRFMDVDLIDFLGKIAEKVIIHYPNDWKTDIDALYRMASSANPNDGRLMWHVSGYGTHLYQERETFIKDTGAFNGWVDYRPHDPDMFGYAVEITGRQGGVIKGNVFDLGFYYAHSLHVRDAALPLESVSLTYSDNWGVNAGKTITVPRFEYDGDRHRLMCESGNVTRIAYHPYEGVREMSDVLRSERAARMAYPIGSMASHLQKLDVILAGARTPPEQPAADKKPSIGDRLRAGKEKSDANRAQNPALAAKKHRKEMGD